MNPFSILNEFDKWFAWQRRRVEQCAARGWIFTTKNCEFYPEIRDIKDVIQWEDGSVTVVFR